MTDETLTEVARSRQPTTVRRAASWLADLVFPPVCAACRAAMSDHDTLCPQCWAQIDFIRPPLCDRLGIPLPYDTGGLMISALAVAEPPAYDRARAAAHYTGVMRDLIHDFKFADRHAPRKLLGKLLLQGAADLLREADVIVPVPLSRQRLLWRRFNQAALLAQDLGRSAGIAYEPLGLVRTRATPQQVGLTRAERKSNVRGAFAVPADRAACVAGKRVLLVDDVITTGSTCSAAARALRRAGAVRVDVLALALVTDLSAVAA